ncbi:MAG: 4Fe-4S binding protein [Lentisphaeria bacterium]|nr:4Fe-4S binding protein [Lentisphaeria bacterium]
MQVVYTNENDCQDCYKCVRRCPVKAINMIDNHASIDDDRCIMCGCCIRVCPVGAQKYRNDEHRVKKLLMSGQKVILAVAPAFVGELDYGHEQLIVAAKKLGFYGVSETALGAQIVTHFQKQITEKADKPVLSTACPTFVQFILKYFPQWKDNLSPLLSPLLSQCVMLKNLYGKDTAIVFLGPCLGKKQESDTHPELLDVSITFDEFEELLVTENIQIETVSPGETHRFIPIQSNGGALYPLDGGMVETMTDLEPSSVSNTSFFHYAGTKMIKSILETEDFNQSQKIFCEFLACEGGCINGSGVFDQQNIFTKRIKIGSYFKSLKSYPESYFINNYVKMPTENFQKEYDFCNPVKTEVFLDKDKKQIWEKLGKFTKSDFIDCGACGYDTCDKFATACLEERAELEMCATSMKKHAHDKVRAFMKETPLALCVVDSHYKIVECNFKFIDLSIDVEIDITEDLVERIKGSHITKFFPLEEIVGCVFRSSERRTSIVHKEGKVYDISAFPFENSALTGLIIQDITKPSMKRDIVIEKAQKVIKNHLLSVQKIAFLLGETAAESEITLNEIISAYSVKEDK